MQTPPGLLKMPPSVNLISSTKPRRWLLILSVGVAFALVAAVFLLTIGLKKHSLRVRIAERIAFLQEAGVPTTAAELDLLFQPPPAQSNSAPLYSAAVASLVGPGKFGDWPFITLSTFPFRTQRMPQTELDAMAAYSKSNQPVLALLHQAARIEDGLYPTGFKNGFGLTSPLTPLSSFRTAAQLLALTAVGHAEQGQPDAAVASINDLFGLARSLKHSPEAVSQMVRVAFMGLGVSATEIDLNQTTLTDAQLRDLSLALGKTDAPDAIQRILNTVRCRAIWRYQTGLAWGGATPPTFLERARANLDRLGYSRDADFLDFFDYLDRQIATGKLDYPKRLEAEITLALAAQDRFVNSLEFSSTAHTMNSVFLGVARGQAVIELGQTALALERWRLVHENQLPESLTNLVPAFLPTVPIDPFNGRPLRYKKLAQGYSLLSLGPDSAPNASRLRTSIYSTTNSTPSDISFTVGR